MGRIPLVLNGLLFATRILQTIPHGNSLIFSLRSENFGGVDFNNLDLSPAWRL